MAGITLDCEEIVFKSIPRLDSAGRTSFKLTNNMNQNGRLILWAWKDEDCEEMFRRYYQYNGRINEDGNGEVDIGCNETIQITITLKSFQEPVTSLPSKLVFGFFESDLDVARCTTERLIQYSISTPTKQTTDGHCSHCTRECFYTCQECVPCYQLCLECAERCGREAHFSFYGEGHELQFSQDSLSCSVCHVNQIGSFHICGQCEEKAPHNAILCMRCFSDHECLISHTGNDWKEHIFRLTESHPTTLKTPVPYYHPRNRQIACGGCRRKITLDFFRCVTCIKEYYLCDGCANGGKIAEHRLHHFEYHILTPEETLPRHGTQTGSGGGQNPEGAR